jgi:hypothetical protein
VAQPDVARIDKVGAELNGTAGNRKGVTVVIVSSMEYERSSTPSRRHRLLSVLPVALIVLAALLLLPLLIGIWLPDVFYAQRHTLAEQKLPNGDTFRVIQYWNRGDFYNTELIHTSPAGAVQTFVLDYDDNKSWRLPLVVDPQEKTATVTLSGGRAKSVSW